MIAVAPLLADVSVTDVPCSAAPRLMPVPVEAVLAIAAEPEAVNAWLNVTVLPLKLRAPVAVLVVPVVIAPVVLTVRAWLDPPKVRS